MTSRGAGGDKAYQPEKVPIVAPEHLPVPSLTTHGQ